MVLQAAVSMPTAGGARRWQDGLAAMLLRDGLAVHAVPRAAGSGPEHGGHGVQVKEEVHNRLGGGHCVAGLEDNRHLRHHGHGGARRLPVLREAALHIGRTCLQKLERCRRARRGSEGGVHVDSTIHCGAVPSDTRAPRAGGDLQSSVLQRPRWARLTSRFRVRRRPAGEFQGAGARAPQGHVERWPQAVEAHAE
eukprot:1667972-Pleurochrysis_carterae.AAC.1